MHADFFRLIVFSSIAAFSWGLYPVLLKNVQDKIYMNFQIQYTLFYLPAVLTIVFQFLINVHEIFKFLMPLFIYLTFQVLYFTFDNKYYFFVVFAGFLANVLGILSFFEALKATTKVENGYLILVIFITSTNVINIAISALLGMIKLDKVQLILMAVFFTSGLLIALRTGAKL